jgi:hypothetical protein
MAGSSVATAHEAASTAKSAAVLEKAVELMVRSGS